MFDLDHCKAILATIGNQCVNLKFLCKAHKKHHAFFPCVSLTYILPQISQVFLGLNFLMSFLSPLFNFVKSEPPVLVLMIYNQKESSALLPNAWFDLIL